MCCGKHMYAVPICRKCRSLLLQPGPFFLKNRCKICGKELISEKDTCLSCREKPLLLQTDGVYPLFPYRLWNKLLLFEWKMAGVRTLSPLFARVVHKALSEIEELQKIGKIPVIPVPPRPGKISENGWDQIDELCRYLSGRYNHTVLPLLIRNSCEDRKSTR